MHCSLPCQNNIPSVGPSGSPGSGINTLVLQATAALQADSRLLLTVRFLKLTLTASHCWFLSVLWCCLGAAASAGAVVTARTRYKQLQGVPGWRSLLRSPRSFWSATLQRLNLQRPRRSARSSRWQKGLLPHPAASIHCQLQHHN